jgi:hypothetical protein
MAEHTPESVAAKLDTHEKVCTERYGNINDKLVGITDRLNTMDVGQNARFNALSNRLWGAAGGAIAVLLVAFGVVAFALFTKH